MKVRRQTRTETIEKEVSDELDENAAMCNVPDVDVAHKAVYMPSEATVEDVVGWEGEVGCGVNGQAVVLSWLRWQITSVQRTAVL